MFSFLENQVSLSILKEHHNFDNIKLISDDYEIVENYKYSTETFIKYKKPKYYYDENIFYCFTGDDGGYKSLWKCNCCENILLIDK